MKANGRIIPQSGVVPFRRDGTRLEVCLITSRGAGRWLMPKGLIEPDLSAVESAAVEAWEEAGLEGRVLRPSLGTWSYRKRGRTLAVEMFPMKVKRVRRHWPEEDRRRAWCRLDEALERVSDRALRRLLARLPKRLR